MKFLRKHLVYLFPLLILLMIVGLVLSRIHRPEPGIPEPEIQISAQEANHHTGKPAEVCGDVASARYLPQIGGAPTFLTLDNLPPINHLPLLFGVKIE